MSSHEAWKDRDRIDAAWKIRSDQQDMIKFADQKVAAVLALSAVLTGFVLANLRAIVEAGFFSLLLAFLYFVITLGLLVVALRALLARGPNAPEAKEGAPSDSDLPKLVYFGHIGKRTDGEKYWSEFADVTERSLLRDLCHQNWELSRIAGEKYRDYRYAWRWMFAQLAVFLLLVIVLLTAPPGTDRATARALVPSRRQTDMTTGIPRGVRAYGDVGTGAHHADVQLVPVSRGAEVENPSELSGSVK